MFQNAPHSVDSADGDDRKQIGIHDSNPAAVGDSKSINLGTIQPYITIAQPTNRLRQVSSQSQSSFPARGWERALLHMLVLLLMLLDLIFCNVPTTVVAR